ncbi:hypothetical protein I79_006936 [Cricetulus griseus]|uniref:Uncharacterized protein n=1 Tax=Cricetulus griseus TaxID=10029 RepID=G3H971_CRIGR|nr:hypothetical protein I79_006936 [Cricetulus griseus]
MSLVPRLLCFPFCKHTKQTSRIKDTEASSKQSQGGSHQRSEDVASVHGVCRLSARSCLKNKVDDF